MGEVRAVIEIGANSVKFYAASKREDGAVEILADEVRVARLGEGLAGTGKIGPAAMERNLALAAAFAARARELGTVPSVVGAMGLRAAANAPDFIARIKELTGLDLRVISGEEEARLSFIAAISCLAEPGEEVAVFDTGGGSTEVVRGKGSEILFSVSLPVGAAPVTEEFFAADPVPAGAVLAAIEKIGRILAEGGVAGPNGRVVGVGGAATTLASVRRSLDKYDPGAVRGMNISLAELGEMADLFASLTLAERKRIPGLAPDRAEIILAGTCIVISVLKALGSESFTVSDRGLRHGLVREMLDR